MRTYYIKMDDRIKRIKELSNKVANKSIDDDKITKLITKKYPELNTYTYKTNKMKIHKGHYIACISINLEQKISGTITSIKYFDYKEGEQRIIKSIHIFNDDTKHWQQINVLHYYIFTKQNFGDINDTKRSKLIIDEILKKYSNYKKKEDSSDSDDITSQDKFIVDFFEEELKKKEK